MEDQKHKTTALISERIGYNIEEIQNHLFIQNNSYTIPISVDLFKSVDIFNIKSDLLLSKFEKFLDLFPDDHSIKPEFLDKCLKDPKTDKFHSTHVFGNYTYLEFIKVTKNLGYQTLLLMTIEQIATHHKNKYNLIRLFFQNNHQFNIDNKILFIENNHKRQHENDENEKDRILNDISQNFNDILDNSIDILLQLPDDQKYEIIKRVDIHHIRDYHLYFKVINSIPNMLKILFLPFIDSFRLSRKEVFQKSFGS
ncbi:hypothetical protein TRFO_21829 [Tritrichomonas foetus]|uniref:Uncharacterized protein n=1 Tax=Tritrichomonas foetus TaxID=1144522 RepID=A0A1J4KDR0_9EUKA|nr:hypothetical protein TRFO_21829 [Tritrichomonas foetus]|eukprot:OHT09331.1 hypothetical protein TRFO_21829 [Tritrichomonas foetus]